MPKTMMDYYFVFVWGCVEPELRGPFLSFDEMKAEAAKERREMGDGEHAYFHLSVPCGVKPEIGAFVGDFDDTEVSADEAN